MPTYQKTLTGTAQKICEANKDRTALTIANMDDTDIAHISDDQGSGIKRTNSYPIFGETYISLERPADQPELAYYGICEGGKTVVIAILEGYGKIVPTLAEPPTPQDPFSPLDAPPMRRI